MTADKLQALHEDLAGAFTESPLISPHTEASHHTFDREALSGLFKEPRQVLSETDPSRLDAGHEALSEIFSDPRRISRDKEPSQLASDREALSELFNEHHPISTSAEPSSSIFDDVALAKLFSEPLPVSANTKPSPPGFDDRVLAEVLNEPRPVPIDPQTSPTSFDTASSSKPLPAQPDNGEPVAPAFAVTSSTNVDGARTQRARSLLTKLHHIFSPKSEPPPSDIENDPLPLTRPDRAGNVESAASAIAVAPAAYVESIHAQYASPLPVEAVAPIVPAIEPSPPMLREPLNPVVAGRRKTGEPAAKADRPDNPEPPPTTAPADAVSGQARQGRPSLTEPRPISIKVEALPRSRDKETSLPTSSGQPDDTKPAAEIVAVAAPANTEIARPQRATSLLAERRAPTSIDTKSPSADLQTEPSTPALAGKLDNARPPVITDAEPREEEPMSSEVPSLLSTMFHPQPRTVESDPSPASIASQPDPVESTTKFVAVALAAETESADMRAQARSPLAELDLDTAIRLRWVMRDIRSRRTKLSPVSDNDLKTLMDLWLVEMRAELPSLTTLGVLALN